MDNRINGERRELVEAARERWKQKLFDMGRRNNLLYFRDMKKGSLRLVEAALPAERLSAFLVDRPLGNEVLFHGQDSALVSSKLRVIRDQARANLEEKGIKTLYLAIGLATWRAPDNGRPPAAPVWLVPVEIEVKGTEGTRFEVRRAGERTVNPFMVYALKQQFGVNFDETGEEDGSAIGPELSQLSGRMGIPDFRVEMTYVLGNFSFQKLAMVQDLDNLGDILVDNDVVSALAGDEEARQALLPQGGTEDPLNPLDSRPPDEDYTVLDADASQLRVIEQVSMRGRSGVVSGPPGTGKSQTIANILAECAARGKSVLFVAQKRAALDVVLRRLADAGLDHLALDLAGADRSKRAIAEQLGQSLSRIRNAQGVDAGATHESYSERRDRLNDYVRSLHQRRDPWGLSAYDMYGRVLTTREAARLFTRLDDTTLRVMDEGRQGHIRERLKEKAALFLQRSSPWFEFDLREPVHAGQVVALVGRIADQWGAFRSRWGSLETVFALLNMDSLATWVQSADGTSRILTRYHNGIFDADLDRLEALLAKGSGPVGRLFHQVFDSGYQQAVREVKAHLIRVDEGHPHLLQDVRDAMALRKAWSTFGGGGSLPVLPDNVAELVAAWEAVWSALGDLKRFRPDVGQIRVKDFGPWVEALAQDSVTPHQVVEAFVIDQELRQLGAGDFIDDLKRRGLASEFWVEAFNHVLYQSALDQVFSVNSDLSRFTREHHEEVLQEFQARDRERIRLNRHRVARRHAQHSVQILNEHPDQEQLVRQEANKQSRHLPLRRFLEQAPHALLALRPCWVASPLDVSQLLPLKTTFDLVLFDEASQVLPEDAIAALARGRQAVVAGDRHQLPPTIFFANAIDDEEDGAEAKSYEGFESLLDQMSSLTPSWSLEWHYRSRDERLIAFSNYHIYGDSLITFPGRGATKPIEHIVVPQALGDQDTDSVAAEAERVAVEVIRLAREEPDQSLGVITMGVKHANRVQMALDEQIRREPSLAGFFDEKRAEPFFVKNLERVQGDERDMIILSVGYGKDANGRLLYRFGPLLEEGGERRLNVAITRARNRMVVISSFDHHDMDPARKSSRGVALLREFLQYATTGGEVLRRAGEAMNVPLNPFEMHVRDALEARGMHLIPQWGVSRYRLDFAVMHPDKPGEFILAIECDGASYHSAPSARDRDRLRQQQLEALGWRFHRIWSTEWFRNPQREIERAMATYEAALQAGGSQPTAGEDGIETEPPTPRGRGPKPKVAMSVPIDRRQSEEIRAVLEWIQSDGILRTNEELIDELVRELGYKRRGPRIEARLQYVVQNRITPAGF